MLSVFLVEELKQKQPVMSYFCTSENERRNSASAVLRSLLWQITSIHPDLAQHFLSHLGAGESDATRRVEAAMSSVETLWTTFTTICCDPRISQLAFILDGLDECDQNSRDWLASKLYDQTVDLNVQHKHPPKIIVVSRDIPRLRLCSKLQLDPDHDDKIGVDVQSFVSARVQELWTMGGFDEKHRRHVERTLLERSEGTFLWVGFAIAELLRKRTILEVEQCLSDLPVGLPAFYNRMLRQIAAQDVDKISKLLQWIILAARPLSLSELAKAIPCKATRLLSAEDVVRDLVTLCHPFLVIQSMAGHPGRITAERLLAKLTKDSAQEDLVVSDAQTVNLIHESARDFMNSRDIPPAFRLDHREAHFEIAWKCMDLIGSDAPFATRMPPLLDYASEYWPVHARKASLLAKPLLGHPSGFFSRLPEVRTWWWHHEMAMRLVNYDTFDFPHYTNTLHLSAYIGFVPWIEQIIFVGGWLSEPALDNERRSHENPLVFAAQQGHDAAMHVLFEHGAKADVCWDSADRLPAIHIFAHYENAMAVRICLDHGTNLMAAGREQQTPLHLAARAGYDVVVRLLLGAGADSKAKDVNQWTALMEAAHRGHGVVVRVLLESGAAIETKNCYGASALDLAAEKGHDHVINMFSARASSFDGATALILAACQGNEMEVRRQLKHGVPVDAKIPGGMTALYCAARGGYDVVVSLLFDWGAKIYAIADASDFAGGKKIMHVVICKFGHDERVGRLIQLCCDSGEDVNAVDDGGRTPLHFAVAYIAPQRRSMLCPAEKRLPFLVAQRLLDHGARIDAADNNGATPIHYAVNTTERLHGKSDELVLRLLLDRGAQANARDNTGRSPLHISMLTEEFRGLNERVVMLLDHGTQVDSEDRDGSTSLHYAARVGQWDVMRLLLDRGAQVDATNSRGQTPLHLAAGGPNGGESVLALLLDRGTEVNARDHQGLTPLNYVDAASRVGYERLLKDRGAVASRHVRLYPSAWNDQAHVIPKT
jgi:ankyrin repeat protein